MSQARHDFFISHTRADRQWAIWIAQTLVANDYSVRLQEWDFLPGNNFVVKMQEAAADHERVLALLSPDYLQRSPFGTPEWAAAFADDPTGAKRQLIPVIVRKVSDSGLLNQIVPIKLMDLGEEEATAELLTGVGSGERHQTDEVAFPGGPANAPIMRAESSPASASAADWAALDTEVSVPFRALEQRNSWASSVILELYAVPVPAQRMQALALRQATDVLAGHGRGTRFFSNTQPLDEAHTADVASVQSQPDRTTRTCGLLITKSVTLAVWEGIAQDNMGAVIDASDIEQRLERLVQVVAGASYLTASRYAMVARIVTGGLYIFGEASTVGHRSAAGGLQTGGATFETPVEDSVSAHMVKHRASDVAAELTARLGNAWTSSRRLGY